MAELSPLRRRMIEDMSVRNLSTGDPTIVYPRGDQDQPSFRLLAGTSRCRGCPRLPSSPHSAGVSWPSLNQIVCALRFFYGVTLGRDTVPEWIAHAREPQKLPIVLSAEEVVRFLEAVASLKSRAALTCAYAAGMRVSEVVRLKVADIDSARGW